MTVLDAAGSAPVYSTYLGGRGDEQANAIALDAAGNAYLTGIVIGLSGYTPEENNFPIANAFKATYSGGPGDSFYAKLSADGSSLEYSSYLSGHPYYLAGDYGSDIAVDAAGNAYVTGSTTSGPDGTCPGFPVVNPWQPNLAGGADAFVTMVSPGGDSLVYSSYLGGSGSDHGYGIAVDPNGAVYVTGQTGSDDFPHTPGVIQPTYGGGDCSIQCSDAFVTKIQ